MLLAVPPELAKCVPSSMQAQASPCKSKIRVDVYNYAFCACIIFYFRTTLTPSQVAASPAVVMAGEKENAMDRCPLYFNDIFAHHLVLEVEDDYRYLNIHCILPIESYKKIGKRFLQQMLNLFSTGKT